MDNDFWKQDQPGVMRGTFQWAGGAHVTVTIDGAGSDPPVQEAEDITMRLTASLDDERFDIRKLGVCDAMLAVLIENKALNRNMSAVQERSTQLIDKARAWRKRLIELGDPDPGPP